MKGSLPLEGVRVLELATQIAGPLCGKYLALAGAEVIRIENPKRLEAARFGDYPGNRVDGDFWNRGGRFHEYNTNKKGIGIDWHHPKGIKLCQQLAAISDVVIENFAPGVLEKRSLGYSSMRQVRPDIIMLSSSAYGQTGPWRSYKGYGPTVEAVSGLAHISGYPHRHPAVARTAMVSDVAAAMLGYYLILIGLNHRKRTGRGMYVDLAQYSLIVSLIGDVVLDAKVNNTDPQREGNRDRLMAPHGVFKCQGEDKWVSIAVAKDDEWKKLCQEMGQPELGVDRRFADTASRYANQGEIHAFVESWTANLEHHEVAERLQKLGISAAPVLNAKELLIDSHFRARGCFHTVDFPSQDSAQADRRLHLGAPWRIPGAERQVGPSPRFGQHNAEVFQSLLGLSDEEFDTLNKEGVISGSPVSGCLQTGSAIEPIPEDVSKELGLIQEYDPDHEHRLGLK